MLFDFVIFAFLGVGTGFLAGFFGMGGGTILVPVLMVLGLDIKAAIGISVMQMVFTSIFGSYINFKKDALNIRDGIVIGIGGFIGASLSGYIVKTFSSKTLEFAFFTLVIFAIYRFFKANTEMNKKEDSSKIKLITIGALTGTTAISLGVGGALILSPVLVGYMGYTIKKAVSMSLFFVVFSSISGFISMTYFGHIDFYYGGIVGVFSLLGVYLGVTLVHKTDPKRHKKLIILLYFAVLGIFLDKVFFG